MDHPSPILNLLKSSLFNLSSWNIQGGLNSAAEINILISDLARYKSHIGCLQETHASDFSFTSDHLGKLICIAAPPNTPSHLQYGLGFWIARALIPNVYKVKGISNRIAIIQLLINPMEPANKQNLMTIINVYAPTSVRVNENISAATDFLMQKLESATTKIYLWAATAKEQEIETDTS